MNEVRHRRVSEPPEAVRTLNEARTGDAVYVVGSDYTIVHWDYRMESLTGALGEEALGKPCYEAHCPTGSLGYHFPLLLSRGVPAYPAR